MNKGHNTCETNKKRKDGRSKPSISVTSLTVNGLSQLSENIVRHG